MPPFNGNGEFDLVAGNPVVPGTTIESTWANSTLSDVAAGLTQTITSDGQSTPLANLPMGGFHHTGVSDPTLRNQYATLGMSQDGRNSRVQITGGVDNLTGTLVGGATAYSAGAILSFFAPATNTGAMTLSYNGIAAKSLVSSEGLPLAAGAVEAGGFYLVLYNGSVFVLLSATSAANVNTYQASTTGWIRPIGGQYPVLTIASATSINVPAGSGYIVPPGDRGADDAIEVTWAAQSVTLNFLASAFTTTITVDAAGTIVQYAGRVIGSGVRTNAILGVVEHFNGIPSNILTAPSIFGDDGYLNRATSNLLAGQIVSGGKVSANGVSPLQMDVSGGVIFAPGASNATPDNPNSLTIPSQNSIPFKTLAGESTVGAVVLNTAPVTQYDPNGAGVVTTIPANGDTVIHRLYYLYGQYIWVFGQFIYTSVNEALTRIEVDRTRRLTSTRLSGATLMAEIVSTKASTALDGANSVILAKGAVYFSIGSAGGIGEAPVNGLTYGRKDAAWSPTIAAATPQVTGDLVITKSAPKVIENFSPLAAGFAGLNVKQGAFDWANIEITNPDDKVYFRSYSPANGNLRNTTTWDLATGRWTFPEAAFVSAAGSATDTTAGRVLKVGDFGLGSKAQGFSTIPGGTLNQGLPTGIYNIDSNIYNAELPVFENGYLEAYTTSTLYSVQVYYTTSGRIFTRYVNAGPFSPWIEVATKANSLGQGQTWQDVTGSRALATVFTNTTGRPIQIHVSCTSSAVSALVVSSGVNIIGATQANIGNNISSATVIIPNGTSYSVGLQAGTASNLNWSELR